MPRRIRPEQFSETVADILRVYSEDFTKGVSRIAEESANVMNDEVHNHITFDEHSGDYVRHMATKEVKKTINGATWAWYVRSPDYRLSHLLEKGHIVSNQHRHDAGKARAFPHIRYGARKGREYFRRHIEALAAGEE